VHAHQGLVQVAQERRHLGGPRLRQTRPGIVKGAPVCLERCALRLQLGLPRS